MPVSWVEMWNKITVWPSPGWIYCLGLKKGAALIVICAIVQTVLMIGLWKPLIAKIASPQLMWDLPCWGKLRKYNTFSKAIKICSEVTICSFSLPQDILVFSLSIMDSPMLVCLDTSAELKFERGCQIFDFTYLAGLVKANVLLLMFLTLKELHCFDLFP